MSNKHVARQSKAAVAVLLEHAPKNLSGTLKHQCVEKKNNNKVKSYIHTGLQDTSR